MSLIIRIALVIGLAILFGWLAIRAGRARRALVKWPGIIVAGLLASVCALVGVMALLGLYKLNASGAGPVANLQVARSPRRT